MLIGSHLRCYTSGLSETGISKVNKVLNHHCPIVYNLEVKAKTQRKSGKRRNNPQVITEN